MSRGIYQHKKGYKFKDTSKMKGYSNAKGKHWKVKDTSRMHKFQKGDNLGEKNPMFGKRKTDETRKKLSEALSGERHPNWIKDRSFLEYTDDWTDILKEAIRQRDKYICQICGVCQDELEERFKKLDIHHIDYNKKSCNPENLITLCRRCHAKTNYNRNYWINYFKK